MQAVTRTGVRSISPDLRSQGCGERCHHHPEETSDEGWGEFRPRCGAERRGTPRVQPGRIVVAHVGWIPRCAASGARSPCLRASRLDRGAMLERLCADWRRAGCAQNHGDGAVGQVAPTGGLRGLGACHVSCVRDVWFTVLELASAGWINLRLPPHPGGISGGDSD